MSAEHVLPQWLRRLVQPPGTSRRTVRFDLASGEIHDEQTKAGSGFAVRPRVVCRACNNGWMSQLEEQVRPLLTPLVRGVPTALTADDGALIAAWCMKTAIVGQYVGEPVTTRTQRLQCKESLKPVPRTKIWIGRYDDPNDGNVWTYAWPWIKDVRRQPRNRSSARPNSHLTILAAGQFLAFVANSPDPNCNDSLTKTKRRATTSFTAPRGDSTRSMLHG
jgi:hypothetical protein